MTNWSHKSVIKLIEESNDEPINAIRERARDLIVKAFDSGWVGPPFNPIYLTRLLNIDIYPNNNIDDARTIPQDSNFLIEYNPYQKPNRINFSIAHEIGHILFTDCSDEIRNRENKKNKNNWEIEFLCNIAASEILLPYAEFAEEANKVSLTLESLINISNLYKASLEAVF